MKQVIDWSTWEVYDKNKQYTTTVHWHWSYVTINIMFAACV